MADNFFTNQPSNAAPNGFMPQGAPAGNPWQHAQPTQPVGGVPQGVQYSTNPAMAAASAAMIYQRLGYWDGQPTEIDIISDIVKSATPVGRFLATEQGLPAMAQFLSVLLDYKLVNFFKDFKLGMVQDEATGAMYLQPLAEQPTDRGKELQTMTMAEVSTAMSSISEQLKHTMIAQADELLSNHRQAAQLMAQQSGVDDVLSAVSGKQKGGIIGAVVGGVANTGLRALGMPVPAVNSMPPPPPGR